MTAPTAKRWVRLKRIKDCKSGLSGVLRLSRPQLQSAKTHSLLLSRSPWSAILEQYPFPASLTNARHAYLYINPAFERFYGLKLADVVGLTPWILMPRQSGVEEVKQMRRRLKANGEIWQGTFDNLNAAGKRVRVHVVALSLSGVPQGAPAAYLSVAGLEKDAPRLLPTLARIFGEHWITEAASTHFPIGEATARGERQDEINRLTRMGYSTKEIAMFMGIADSTVANVKWKLKQRGTLSRSAERSPQIRRQAGREAPPGTCPECGK